MILSAVITFFELCWSIHAFQGDLTSIACHYFLTLAKFGGTCYVAATQIHTDKLQIILRTIDTTQAKLTRFDLPAKHTDHHLVPVLLLLAVSLPLIYIFGIPILSALYSEQLHTFIMVLSGDFSINIWWKIIVLILDVISMIPIGFVSSMICSIALVVLEHTQYRICSMINVLTIVANNVCLDDRFKLGILYREAQLFTHASNGAVENCVWAVTQFVGASALIQSLFSLIALRAILSAWIIKCFCIVFFIVFMYCLLMFYVRGLQAS